MHRRIGVCLEACYGAQTGDIAAQLAIHFECGGEVQRAVRYFQQVADTAVRRNALCDQVGIDRVRPERMLADRQRGVRLVAVALLHRGRALAGHTHAR